MSLRHLVARIAVGVFALTAHQTAMAGADHGTRRYASTFAVGSVLPSVSVSSYGNAINLVNESAETPVIVVRYLGFSCVHCVEQLTYLNRYASRLKALGIRVIAFSTDNAATNAKLVERMGYNKDVLMICSDEHNEAAATLGAVQTISDTLIDAHATLVIYRGRVCFSAITSEPYMDVEKLVAVASSQKQLPSTQTSGAHPADRYLGGSAYPTTIAGPSDGITAPLDLDFNQGRLHPTDLWVVLTSSPGNSIAIIHNAPDSANRTIRIKKDSRASHFMWRTHAIAMGSNGTFATAQNGAPGDHNPFYQFMGPTLWSSDTAVFASRYQDDKSVLASHLDMLHQSPQNLGIAHDHDNVYWVSDAYYHDISRYDFKDPHEVGGTDHRDGVIRRYPDAQLSAGNLYEPGHIALDKQTGLLYIVDPGANIVTTLDTRTGMFERDLIAPEESAENLAEYSEWRQATVDTLIADGLGEPVGIEVNGNRLFVGDRQSGNILFYDITGGTATYMGKVATGAKELLGICYGPDGRLWFTDRATSTVGRLDTDSDADFTPVRDVSVVARQATVEFTYHNFTAMPYSATADAFIRPITADGSGEWMRLPNIPTFHAPGNSSATVGVEVELPDTLHAFEIEIREILPDYSEGRRARCVVVPQTVEKAVVDDATMEVFRITEAVQLTSRSNYVSLPSNVFASVASQLPNLSVVLWNGGSFGEISVTDDAVINGLLDRGVELMLIADDPLLIRTDLPRVGAFFSRLGVRLIGADYVSPDNGQRIFNGVAQDPISNGMKNVAFQLPRLDHQRGVYYVPNVVFATISDSTHGVLVATDTNRMLCARYTVDSNRTVLLGINGARFQNGSVRSTVLDKSLEWLEQAVSKDTSTPVHVAEQEKSWPLHLEVRGNGVTNAMMIVVGSPNESVEIGLYSVGGQNMCRLYSGVAAEGTHVPLNMTPYALGTYFVIARTTNRILYTTVVKN